VLHKIFIVSVNTTIILPVVLYENNILSLILSEEHRLRVFENRVLRRILGPKRLSNRRLEKTAC
jgi:hypothetical protein